MGFLCGFYQAAGPQLAKRRFDEKEQKMISSRSTVQIITLDLDPTIQYETKQNS
jgi:hypothetical protein